MPKPLKLAMKTSVLRLGVLAILLIGLFVASGCVGQPRTETASGGQRELAANEYTDGKIYFTAPEGFEVSEEDEVFVMVRDDLIITVAGDTNPFKSFRE